MHRLSHRRGVEDRRDRRQGQVGDDVRSRDDFENRKVGHGRHHVLEQLKPRWTGPRLFHRDVGNLGSDQVRAEEFDGENVGHDLHHERRHRDLRLCLLEIHLLPLVRHRCSRHTFRSPVERPDQSTRVDRQPRRSDDLRKCAELAPRGGRGEVVEVHRAKVLTVLAVQLHRDRLTRLGVRTESVHLAHLHHLEPHERVVDGQRFRNDRTQRVRICAIGDWVCLSSVLVTRPSPPASDPERRTSLRRKVRDYEHCRIRPPRHRIR